MKLNPNSHGVDGTEDVYTWYCARNQTRRMRKFYALTLPFFQAGLISLHAEPELAGVSHE